MPLEEHRFGINELNVRNVKLFDKKVLLFTRVWKIGSKQHKKSPLF